jgi:hypothetical protein
LKFEDDYVIVVTVLSKHDARYIAVFLKNVWWTLLMLELLAFVVVVVAHIEVEEIRYLIVEIAVFNIHQNTVKYQNSVIAEFIFLVC